MLCSFGLCVLKEGTSTPNFHKETIAFECERVLEVTNFWFNYLSQKVHGRKCVTKSFDWSKLEKKRSVV